ncbi:MAG: HAMP domain-containing histidine kinase [Nitrospirae bacterium]|nr:HAMP domain-containing histidine kinase [Nitrospirota bacterium]
MFQNKIINELFQDGIKPKDYKALSSLLLPDIGTCQSPDYECKAHSLSYKGKILGYTVYHIAGGYIWVFLLDITEKARLESIAEAANTSNSIGYIFTGIRHEIGNPLNSLKTTLSVLRNNLDKYPHETVKEYIDRSLGEIARLEYLLRSLKSYNMHESQEIQNISTTAFIDRLLPLVEKDFEARGIRIKTIIHPAPEWICADLRALHQVVLNILTNAADALEGREDPSIVISVFKMSKYATIRVVDSGCGIPEEEKGNLFKPFYTSKNKGTGLGLSIVRKMLAQMNGAIEITSLKDAGTIVDIFVPAGRAESA